ncbi:hypothetical protein TRIUR3_20001 [Triticum urartu]|uniref:Uncharacterized protein n=1 Tax=Triticum urartu TaxID=4572 RepID=M8A3C7_TRIUA|nr:hypothetical protein TRIUR3_20001 [Triticum urartu]
MAVGAIAPCSLWQQTLTGNFLARPPGMAGERNGGALWRILPTEGASARKLQPDISSLQGRKSIRRLEGRSATRRGHAAIFSLPIIMPLPPPPDWVPLSEEGRMVDEEQVEEKGVLIAEEEEEKEESRYVLEAVQEDPAPNDWSNWNTKTYSIE